MLSLCSSKPQQKSLFQDLASDCTTPKRPTTPPVLYVQSAVLEQKLVSFASSPLFAKRSSTYRPTPSPSVSWAGNQRLRNNFDPLCCGCVSVWGPPKNRCVPLNVPSKPAKRGSPKKTQKHSNLFLEDLDLTRVFLEATLGESKTPEPDTRTHTYTKT